MSIMNARIKDFYDRHVTELIIQKYGMNDRKALRLFIESETYQMLLDEETGIYQLSPHILFDMWECEKITGNPRDSEYIRE